MSTSRPHSNVTTSGSQRVVTWIDAQSGSGSDGSDIDDADVIGDQGAKTGIYALNRVPLFNLLCIPPSRRDTTSLPSNWTPTSAAVYQAALSFCVERRAMLIVDPDPAWGTSIDRAIDNAIDGRNDLNLTGPAARNAALYFPCVREVDPLRDSRVDTFVPSGIIAGIMARTDVARGVWKAPAGLDASLNGVQDLQVTLNDLENGQLNPLGINCLRSMGVNGRIVWGARTLRGADESADEYKYVPVRRLALFLEESLYRGTQWVVFEPNDEPLWAQVRLNVGAFMQGLFRQGAFQGATPKDAYFVKCDSQTTTQNDINLGILNVIVGFAPLKPAEFVVIQIQQMAGQIPT
jgi:phage tail sheath protein FI